MIQQHTMPKFMYDLDEHLEKLLYAQHMLVDALRKSKEHLSQMNQNEREEILDKSVKCSQWTAPLEEQLEWTQDNQSTITHFGNRVTEEETYDE